MIRSQLVVLIALAHAQAAPTPQPPAAPPRPAPQLIVLDLATLAAGATQVVSVTASDHSVVHLANRVPGARYRVQVDALGRPPTPSVLAPVASPELPNTPQCSDARAAAGALHAAQEEPALPPLVARLEQALARCPAGAAAGQALLDGTRPLLGPVYVRGPAKAVFTIERLDAKDATLRRWHVSIEAGRPAVGWSHRNEEEWIVAQVLAHLVRLTQGGAGPVQVRAQGEPGDPFTSPVLATQAPKEWLFDALGRVKHIWDPAAYVAAAATLLGPARPAAATAGKPGALEALTDRRLSVLLAENERISAWLSRAPLDPAAHEDAALLLATFALGEAASTWSDTRPVLSRATAHLALARALRADRRAGATGQFAELAVEALAGREFPAVGRIAELRATAKTRAQVAWLNALALRASSDWRTLKDPKAASLLERLEHSRALVRAFNGLRAMEFLGEREPEPIADWGRRVLEVAFSVEAGNAFAPSRLPSEIEEIGEAWRALRGDAASADPVALLARSPAQPGGVLSWELLSDFYERHLIAAADETEMQLETMLGAKDDAARFRTEALRALAPLRRLPLLQLDWVVDLEKPGQPSAERGPLCERAAQLVRQSPERVSPNAWGLLQDRCSRQRVDATLPDLLKWHARVYPRGTAYGSDWRPFATTLTATLDAAQAGEVLGLRYQSVQALVDHVRVTQKREPTAADIERTFPRLLEFSFSALQSMLHFAATTGDDVRYLSALQRLCSLEATSCLTLGSVLFARERDVESIAAFEKAVANARDRVAVSNELDFLIDLYVAAKRDSDADGAARMAAATGSATGIASYARLLERRGRFAEAHAQHRAVVERYPDTRVALNAFYVRRGRAGDPAFRQQAEAALRELFPAGMRQVTVAQLPRPTPQLAAEQQVLSAWYLMDERLTRLGVRKEDFIAAVDGYRVQNQDQFRAVRTLSDEPRLSLVVLRDGKYVELSGRYRRVKYGPV